MSIGKRDARGQCTPIPRGPDGSRAELSPRRSPCTAVMVIVVLGCIVPARAQLAIRGDTLYPMSRPAVRDGVVLIGADGKISAVGPASDVSLPPGCRVLQASVVTPGLIDAHATVGLSGLLNQSQDQDQLDRSAPIQPELRAIDAYNAHDPLVAWVRQFGVTTIHTGHAPGELISGQSMIAKTFGNTVEEAVIVESAAIAATLSQAARKKGDKSPGTRGKMIAMLRSALIRAQEYHEKLTRTDENERPDRDLKQETLGRVLRGEIPLLIHAHRAQDIASALRLAREFDIRVYLDGAAEAYLLVDEIKAAGVPVIVHPTMARSAGELKNLSFETAAKLRRAGIPVALQSGYESYVPKTRVVLFEAAIVAANGASKEDALAMVTLDAAGILGIADRVGSLEVGKDGDVALFDGDPFEYTTHCVGVVIDGCVVSDTPH